MSWIDDIVSFGSNAVKMVSSSNIGSALAQTAVLGLLLNQMNKGVNKQPSLPDTANSSQPDRFVREQMSPDTNHSIPVVYGSAFIKGIITDAFMADDNQTMWYCITICEKTGTLLSNSQDSVISFNEIWRNNQKLIFNADGVTVSSAIDENQTVTTDPSGLIEVYCFNNGSNSPVLPTGYSNVNLFYAQSVMPNWSVNHLMSDLVFCIVKIRYNKEKDITSLGEFQFKLTNSMTLPGDVIYDYMTNTRYGGSIPVEEIYSE
jgi:hypothetical protein